MAGLFHLSMARSLWMQTIISPRVMRDTKLDHLSILFQASRLQDLEKKEGNVSQSVGDAILEIPIRAICLGSVLSFLCSTSIVLSGTI